VLETALKIQAEIPLALLMEWREQADNGQDVAGFDGYNGDLTGDKAATLGVNCGMSTGRNGVVSPPIAFACNQRDEVRDLNDVAGAVQAQPGMKQQTFVAESAECLTPWDVQSRRIHREDGVWPALYGGEGGGHGYVQAGCLNGWETQQARVFTPGGVAPTLAGADGAGGRNPAGLVLAAGVVSKGNGDCFITPEQHTALTSGGGQAGQGYPCVMAAAFCAGAGAKAGSIGYEVECAPTLKGSEGGNIMPSVICLNDQGGQRMDVSENHVGTLRSQMDGHPPLVMATQQGGAEICEDLCPTITSAAGTSGNNGPCVFENHGIDSRYTGPHDVAPTVTSRFGTGGNNVPLAIDEPEQETYAIAGNIVGRQPHNGGNGFGYQLGISYTITSTDRHCVYSQQRSDEYMENDVASTQAARQYKDSTDLVCEVAGLDLRNGNENGDLSGTLQSKTSGGYSLNNLHPIRIGSLVRRLTPLECERLMGFPDGWTNIPGASDSKRYRACGNSVAIPCVEFIMMGIAAVYEERRSLPEVNNGG